MKLMSWNVNGIRAACRNGFLNSVTQDYDAVLLQEVKAEVAQIPEEMHNLGYAINLFAARKRGYSGTMALHREGPLNYRCGTGHAVADSEGRVQTLEYPEFYLVNAYFPNSQRDLARLQVKTEFNFMMQKYCKSLGKKKPVVICGDFNVAHTDMDIARPDENRNNAGFTEEERKWMTSFLADGFIDTFRIFTSEGGHYSWWSYRKGVRSRNIGWRIDYFIVSESLAGNVKSAGIIGEATGSDHAPVTLELEF